MAVLIFLPILIIVFVAIYNKGKDEVKAQEAATRRRDQEIKVAKQRKEQELREEKEQAHQRLVLHYVQSPLLREILNYLCDGSYEKITPDEIIIRNEGIQSRCGGVTRNYDFSANRVKNIDTIIKSGSAEDIRQLAKPQVAIGEAINHIMRSKFAIYDMAKQDHTIHTHSDGEIYCVTTYVSQYVVLKNKTLLPNRTL